MKRSVESVLEDIKNHPERHRHDFDGLYKCCAVNGIVRPCLLKAHAQYVDLGTNGGIRCDVVKGACSCGAWH